MKIDLTKIDGYQTMTPEQKLSALEAFEFDTSELDLLRAETKNQKSLIDKYTGEIGALKKKQNEGLSEAERKAREQESAMSELQEKYDALLKESTIAKYKAKYLSLGYDETLAASAAENLANNKMDEFFDVVAKHLAEVDKRQKAEAARSTPKPDGKGAPAKVMTQKDILGIKDTVERQKAIEEHLDLFE